MSADTLEARVIPILAAFNWRKFIVLKQYKPTSSICGSDVGFSPGIVPILGKAVYLEDYSLRPQFRERRERLPAAAPSTLTCRQLSWCVSSAGILPAFLQGAGAMDGEPARHRRS